MACQTSRALQVCMVIGGFNERIGNVNVINLSEINTCSPVDFTDICSRWWNKDAHQVLVLPLIILILNLSMSNLPFLQKGDNNILFLIGLLLRLYELIYRKCLEWCRIPRKHYIRVRNDYVLLLLLTIIITSPWIMNTYVYINKLSPTPSTDVDSLWDNGNKPMVNQFSHILFASFFFLSCYSLMISFARYKVLVWQYVLFISIQCIQIIDPFPFGLLGFR